MPAADPQVERNCQKLTDLTLQRMPPGGLDPEQMLQTCISKSTESKETDPERFARETDCLEQATMLEEFLQCVREPAPSDLTAQIRSVCEKMLELAETDPDLPEEVKKELRDIDKCIVEGQEAHDADPEQFENMSTCVLSGSSFDGVIRCAIEANSPAQ